MNRIEKIPKRAKTGFFASRVGYSKHLFVRSVYLFTDIVLFLPLLVLTVLSRLARRPIDIGLGPVPTINSKYHKKCLERFGYRCETFVYHTWYFTQDFDVMFNRYVPRALGPYVSYIFAIFRYRCIYTYFTGGPLGFTTLLARCEPFLFQLAGIKTMVMPFGSDVHELTRTSNKLMVHGYAMDYPGLRHSRTRTAALIDVWTRGADHIISGCDWVEYMYYWDTLMLAHFAIDVEAFRIVESSVPLLDEPCTPLRLIHAPNHRNLKGTDHIIKAVKELQQEGLAIDLAIVEGISNAQIPARIQAADVVIDQLVLGWYAMFALEGMALGKPVVCHLRQDFVDLYTGAGLLEPGELPLIDATVLTLKDTIRHLASLPRRELREIGLRSRAFVERHHSIQAVGEVFHKINQSIGIQPTV